MNVVRKTRLWRFLVVGMINLNSSVENEHVNVRTILYQIKVETNMGIL